MKDYVTIVGAEGPLTNGTKVVLPDGSEMQGVYKIELTGEVNETWKAVISCHAKVESFQAELFTGSDSPVSLGYKLKHHKAEAERKISEALNEYHKDTGLIPEQVEFEMIGIECYGSIGESPRVLVGDLKIIAKA